MSKINQPSVSIETSKHCNLKCAGCDHASPWFQSASFYALDVFERDMDALAAVMEIGELVFAGGEPLMHPDLVTFLEIAKRKRYAEGVTLITNGVLLHRAPVEIWQLLDGLSVSRYPGVRIRVSDDELRALGERHGTRVVIEESSKFKHILVNDPIDDPTLIQSIFKGCYAAVNCHTVFEGRYYKCSRAHLMSEILGMAGIAFENMDDGIELHAPDLGQRLATYLNDGSPLKACRHCLGSHGRERDAGQLRPQGVVAEQQDRTSYRELLDPGAPRTPEETTRPATMGKWWLGESFVQQTPARDLTLVTKSD
jgi:organic radical activating enzyme